jgi:hypothetical protein
MLAEVVLVSRRYPGKEAVSGRSCHIPIAISSQTSRATLFFTESRALLPQVKGAWNFWRHAGIASGSMPRSRKQPTTARHVFVS